MNEKTDVLASTNTALVVNSSHFESRKVQAIDSDSLLIKPTILALAFSLVFVILGLSIAAVWTASRLTTFDGPDSVPLLLIGVLFLVAGLGTYYSSNEQLFISRLSGAGFIRTWFPANSTDNTVTYKKIPPKEIIAVQTIARFVKRRSNRSSRSNSYTEYQVNLCTLDNERHNAFVTLKPEKADQLGQQLAKIFSVPLHAH